MSTTTTAAPATARPVKRGLRLPELMIRTGLKKTAIYAAIKRGELPAPKKIGGASIWPEEAIDRIMAGDEPDPPATSTTGASS